MKSLVEKKGKNSIDNVKVLKEFGSVCNNILDANARNTKDYFNLLEEVLKSNNSISSEYKKFVEKEMDSYKMSLEKSTSEEERKSIFEEIKKLHEDVNRIFYKQIVENSNIKEKATKNMENNKELTRNVLKIIGVGLLFTIGITVGVKNRTNVINKLIDKK